MKIPAAATMLITILFNRFPPRERGTLRPAPVQGRLPQRKQSDRAILWKMPANARKKFSLTDEAAKLTITYTVKVDKLRRGFCFREKFMAGMNPFKFLEELPPEEVARRLAGEMSFVQGAALCMMCHPNARVL